MNESPLHHIQWKEGGIALRKEYAVWFGGETAGTACVTREGLYYRISCRCRLSGSVPCSITARAEREADLGLCVPLEDQYGLEIRIPIKCVGEGDLEFRVSPKHRVRPEQFIPISSEGPFAYIARLKDAYMVRRDGQTGIVTKDRSPSPQDSDQNP